MRGAGLKAYRFSISWPRVLPDGTGQPDQRGLDFYSRLVDALLKAGIEPWVCLYHWDLPQALQDRGGWGNREIADWFADYARLMAQRLGDRVTRWVMLNEPSVHRHHRPRARRACARASKAATRCSPRSTTRTWRKAGRWRRCGARAAAGSRLGTVLSLQPVRPAERRSADNRRRGECGTRCGTAPYLDPLFHGRYPSVLEPYVDTLMQPDDLAQIQQPSRFPRRQLLRPMYQRVDPAGLVGTNWGALPAGTQGDRDGLADRPGRARTRCCSICATITATRRVYITENGAYFAERPGPGGRVDDEERIAYLRDHIAACQQRDRRTASICAGYFVWTIIDNFEWAYGYTATFGLVAGRPRHFDAHPKGFIRLVCSRCAAQMPCNPPARSLQGCHTRRPSQPAGGFTGC